MKSKILIMAIILLTLIYVIAILNTNNNIELWVRSQDREGLILAQHLDIYCVDEKENIYAIEECGNDLGNYKSKERALEILDEIQSKLHGTFLLKAKEDSYANELIEAQKYFEKLNSIFPVIGAEKFDLEPINKDIYVYEMPQE